MDEKLLSILEVDIPWFIDISNYLATKVILEQLTWQQNKKLFHGTKSNF